MDLRTDPGLIAELQAKIAGLQATLDATTEGLMVTDLDGRLVTANARASALLDLEGESVVGEGSAHSGLVDKLFVDADQLRAGVDRILTDPEAESLDVLELRDGRVLERRSSPQRIDGETVGRVWRFRDITEAHRARLEQQVLEARFRQTLENVSLLAVALDTTGRVTFANDFLLDLTGWSREETIGSDWFERFLPDPEARAAFDREITIGAIPNHVEREIVTRAGVRRQISLSNSVLRDADGAIVGVVSVGQDVTGRRRIEARYRSTLEGISLVAAGIDAQGRVTFANDYLLALTGWSREEVLGEDWFERFDADPVVRADYFDCMRRGEIRQHFESTIHTRAGELRTIRWSSNLEVDEAGQAAGIVTIGEDVTEQRQQDDLLREREEYFRTLIENASDVISVFTPDGTSLYESPSVARVLGWTPEEIVGTKSFVLRHPDDAEQVERAVASIVAGEDVPPLEFRLQHKDGSWRTVEAIARLRLQDGEPVVVSNYRDITERRELQEQLLHAQKLEAVGRLAGGIAHDFNNLLTAIGGYTEFLVGGFDVADPRRGDAIEIQRATERAAALTRQLLAFSRRQVLQPEVLDVSFVVADLESLLARLLGEAVELTSSVDPGCFVEADRGQLEQVITNLAVNARDAMPSGGVLSVRARHVQHEGKPHVEIEVADTGTGMDSDTLAHLFEPFYTTKDKGKGTGLGLATVYGIVAQSGGEVRVESELDSGSRFSVLLPLAPAPEPVTEAPAEPQLALSGAETILLVEDEDTIRRLVRDVLGRSGYTVLDAPEGESALELLRANEIDLLLTDVVMPGMSGPELARLATTERPSLRVLFTSGYTNEPEEILAGPGAAFIGKPFSPKSLVAKVREVLDSSAPNPERAASRAAR